MPGRVILACEMIEDEVRLALESLAPEERPPLVWMESGLHDRPERLQASLGELVRLLDEGAAADRPVNLPAVRPGRGPAAERREEVTVEPVDEVILALGFCGNALKDLSAEHLTLVFPRVDDCVSLLLNDGCVREEIKRNPRCYYLTKGWFSHESSMLKSFDDWDERYGRERADALRATMYAGYEQINLIDTKAYDVDEYMDQSQAVADKLNLEHDVVRGSVQLLEKLFRGERDSEIVAVPPGEKIGFYHLFGERES
jgi:Protein of unknown function (DUF1638)